MRAPPRSSRAAAATAFATAAATPGSNAPGMMCSRSSFPPAKSASARTAAAFIAAFISRDRASSAPRKTPGKARTLFIWLGKSLLPVPATYAPAATASP